MLWILWTGDSQGRTSIQLENLTFSPMIHVNAFPQHFWSTGVMFSSRFGERCFRSSCSSEALMISSAIFSQHFISIEDMEPSHEPKLLLLDPQYGGHIEDSFEIHISFLVSWLLNPRQFPLFHRTYHWLSVLIWWFAGCFIFLRNSATWNHFAGVEISMCTITLTSVSLWISTTAGVCLLSAALRTSQGIVTLQGCFLRGPYKKPVSHYQLFINSSIWLLYSWYN